MFNEGRIIQTCREYGLEITADQEKKLNIYCDRLSEANRTTNLTRNDSEEDMLVKNIIDCLFLAHMIPDGVKVIDIGCGAGFPGIVLATVKNVEILMIDSIQKKIAFVDEIIKELDLSNAQTLATRVEVIAKDTNYRESFDYAVSRAVASLNMLLEYSAPMIKVKGKILSMKGSKAQEEISLSANALQKLNCRIEDNRQYILLGNIERHIIEIVKEDITDDIYPRTTKKIIKNPL